ncbi:TKL protein kinase [Phytophthora nicotianae]|uniref:TKL protein kinase n=1 Tax=Phytophthora nicotianae TaxID=4792 RepID=W2ICD2_PHYNI|nr:TKL protein kinase [Phytophthora nicotianae]
MAQHNAVQLLTLILTSAYWFRPCGAVDVGEAEESASTCPNVTTVSTPSNSTSSSTKIQITDASCTSSVVKVRGTTLDLRHRDIAAVTSLPTVSTVKLDNNELRAFTTSSNISELYMSNNSIPAIDEFKFPTTLTLLDLANNALGDLAAADLPPSLQYLNLSGNLIGSLSNVSFPSSLLRLDAADANIAILENFSFPSSLTTLNLPNNPITTIKGVIFPDSLTELTLIATANSATTPSASVVTPDEARVLQTTAEDPTEQTISVLEEFEVRQSDADRFEKLTLWDVSTTSTLSCSDSNANPRYVQDTMLCVLSDNEFADKYEHVLLAASSGSTAGSIWGKDDSSSQEVERIALKETLDQRRSWFLIGAAALLSAFTVMLCVNGLCLSLRRSVRGASKGKSNQAALTKSRSARPNNFWNDSTSMEPDDEVHHLLTSDPPAEAQPEPEYDAETGNCTAKKTKATDPLVHLLQEIPHSEIDGSLVTYRELLSPIPESEESSSAFVYFKAAFHGKTVVLKTLSIAGYLESKSGLAELWGFVEEIRLSSTLSHPQIVTFYGFTKVTDSDEGVALAMEYMDKGDLNMFIQDHKRSLQRKHALIRDDKSDDDYDIRSDDEIGPSLDRHDSGKWNWRDSSVYKSKLSIAVEVAQAVQYLHSFTRPLFHGNLSSRKVFLDSDWNVKLGDLTCCSALRRWSSSHKSDISSLPSTATRSSGRSNCSSQTAGEEIHMDMTVWTAPEVLDGRQYTQKADIYSFGVLLSQLATYECTSAEHSVMDDTDVPMLNNTDKEQTSDGEAPTPIRLLMFRCQAFQPEIRPTADELIQELRQIQQELKQKTQ